MNSDGKSKTQKKKKKKKSAATKDVDQVKSRQSGGPFQVSKPQGRGAERRRRGRIETSRGHSDGSKRQTTAKERRAKEKKIMKGGDQVHVGVA